MSSAPEPSAVKLVVFLGAAIQKACPFCPATKDVVPVKVPSLRERESSALPLAFHHEIKLTGAGAQVCAAIAKLDAPSIKLKSKNF